MPTGYALKDMTVFLNFIKSSCKVTQSCLTFCSPMDCRSPGFSVHGISQARILEWVLILYSKGSSQPTD